MNAVMRSDGVTSKAGFHASTSGATVVAPTVLTSSADRSSISIDAPSAASGSNDDIGPAT
jgi:hypothetical protein